MSIVVRFNPKNVTREKYDEVVRRLEQAGEWPHPPGLEFRLYGSEGEAARRRDLGLTREPRGVRADVFPIMSEIGIEMASEPEIYEVQNIVKR